MTFWPFFLILSLDVSSSFFSPFSLIIHSFQEGKHAAGTNFPGRVNCPKWLPFPMFPQKKQPCQLSPARCFTPWAAWRGCLWAKWAPGWAGWASRWESGPLSCPLFTVQECHSTFCLPFPWKWKNSSRSCRLLLLVLSLQESASSVLNFTICFLRSCHFKRNLSGFKWLQFLSAYNL